MLGTDSLSPTPPSYRAVHMVKKRVLIPLLEIGVPLLLLLSLLIFLLMFNYYSPFPSCYEGDEGIAERRAREYFSQKYPSRPISSFSLIIYDMENPLFKHHSLYFIKLYFTKYTICFPKSTIIDYWVPNDSVIIAVGRDKRAFVLPDEFNSAIVREDIEVSCEERALDIVSFYLFCGGRKLLYSARDIPWSEELRDVIEGLKDTVKPPRILKKDDGYLLELFSWRWGRNGTVERWIVDIKENGVINVLEKTVVAQIPKKS
ncbi:MAG: hypothetical protein DSO07_00790 [Thermoproteota archaeon]|uniref:Uncharacterized protein n=1 Tax=Candidatus Methanodesulfokora washburnensis TaxID=2478471 RepID=A0A3R9QFY5_9CREN|nr:hypothetical protein [Candidatus Methanodesulfokores washburnensis]RSN75599.1 hypothetical protein D6D85_05860 [Candidatus Methanodesulfokores washburnensis]TDA42163.1 MAG: hypothetical protein DSO07_00790 [Candidatus Korarchaeota archaeon]